MYVQDIIHEALHWKRLSHPHILPFLGLTRDHHLSLVSPWMSNGNILEYLEKNPNADELLLVRHTYPGIYLCSSCLLGKLQLAQAAHGLVYLHACHLMHGDIKAVSSSTLPSPIGPLTLALTCLITAQHPRWRRWQRPLI